MTGLLDDLRYTLRQLKKSPGFAATAILVLALGLGATTGMLAIVQSVLLRPLNYREPDRMMLVGISEEATESSDISYSDLQEMKRSLHQFEDFGAYSNQPLAVQTADGAQMLVAPAVTTNFFDLLGVKPEFGRSFRAGDDQGEGSAVVSHEFWQHSMHGRQDVVGSTLKINQKMYTVVGVMPPHFQFPLQTETLWTTLQLSAEQKTKDGRDKFSILGRLKSDASLDQARAAGEAFVRNRPTQASSPEHFWLYPYQNLVTGEEKPAVLALFGACLLLLIIAVVNTANLQIARATRREVEIAMRAALGATRLRILRQLVVESLVLSLAGAALGWMLAYGFVKTAANLFQGYARFDELRLDVWTFVGCLLLTSICGVLAALAPAWHVLGRSRNLSLQHTGRGSRPQRVSGPLVTAEVALTCILLVGAGLFLRTFRAMQNAPLGFSSDHVTGFIIWPQGGDIPVPVAQTAYQRVLDRLQSMPGVEAAGTVTSLPVSHIQITVSESFTIPGHPAPGPKDKQEAHLMAVSSGYLKAIRVPLLAGRNISDTDSRGGQLVGVVNQAFVDRYLHGMDALGKQIVLDKDEGAEFPQPITIVGVSGDVIQENDISSPIEPEVMLSFTQLPPASMLTHFLVAIATSFAVRSNNGLAQTATDIRNVVKTEAPEFAIDDLSPLSEKVDEALRTRRLAVAITSVFAWIALLLSAAGLYGVLAYLLAQRVREIGIRLALGATRENVFLLLARQGIWMVGAGLVLGWVGSLFAARWIRSFLFGTTSHDPLTYASAGALVIGASAVAILFPARRAAAIEPMEALRAE